MVIEEIWKWLPVWGHETQPRKLFVDERCEIVLALLAPNSFQD
jgi:hypothetical protein